MFFLVCFLLGTKTIILIICIPNAKEQLCGRKNVLRIPRRGLW